MPEQNRIPKFLLNQHSIANDIMVKDTLLYIVFYKILASGENLMDMLYIKERLSTVSPTLHLFIHFIFNKGYLNF